MIKSISQHVEKYHMGHYDIGELVLALIVDDHFDSIQEAALFLEEEYGSSNFRAEEIIWDVESRNSQ
jgi:hypothetical protein